MSLEDEFKEAIKKALDENARERAANDTFLEGWRSARREIHQALETAAQVLRQELNMGAVAELENGSSALLKVAWNRKADTEDHALKFAPNDSLKILRSSSVAAKDEVYDLAALTEEVVKFEVKSFIAGVIRERKR